MTFSIGADQPSLYFVAISVGCRLKQMPLRRDRLNLLIVYRMISSIGRPVRANLDSMILPSQIENLIVG